MLAIAESEGVGLDGAGALEAPTTVGDGLGDVALEIADGGEGIEDDLAVFLVGLVFVGREDVDFAGESVAIGI
jgi:hypothetical protein